MDKSVQSCYFYIPSKIYPPKPLQPFEPEFTLSELRVTFVKESLVRTKAGQTVTHKVILKLWGHLEPTKTCLSHLLQSHNTEWPWREVAVICHHATCILGPRQRRWGGLLMGSGGVVSQQ